MVEGIEVGLLRAGAAEGKIQWRQHALERLLERGITREEVQRAILNGEVIEVYPKDHPYPSCLILHIEQQALHVVAAVDSGSGICHVITAYRPDLDHFEPDFKTRSKRS
jgi:hypothetical protein